MIYIELKSEQFESLMYITNGQQFLNKNDVLIDVYLKNFLDKDTYEAIKSNDNEILCIQRTA